MTHASCGNAQFPLNLAKIISCDQRVRTEWTVTKIVRVCDAGAGGRSHPVQPSSSAEAAAWSGLAGLYEQLSQYDIVQVIYTKHLSRSAILSLQNMPSALYDKSDA